MAGYSNLSPQASEGTKRAASAPWVTAAALILILLIGGLYYANFGPSHAKLPPGPTVASHLDRFLPATDQQWVAQKAKECGGEIGRLSEADRQRLHKIFKGGEYMAMAQMSREQAAK